jgi:dTDP-4-dehydrorhamnose reductase
VTTLLITGARGQLGTALVAAAAQAGIPAQTFDSTALDITDALAVDTALTGFARWSHEVGSRADDVLGRAVVVNAAAYTAVDRAEEEPGKAFAVNATGPGHLARAAGRLGLGLIHVSTDYVFPGDAASPYRTDDPTGPASVYGSSKLAGERAVLEALPEAHVVRTAWVWARAGSNFVTTMIRLAAERPTVRVVDDQQGTPTYAPDLADGLLELAGADLDGGILHATNSGVTTWFDFARAIFGAIGADPARVQPTSSAEFARPAPRPAYSVLSNDAWATAGLTPLRPWQEALASAGLTAAARTAE